MDTIAIRKMSDYDRDVRSEVAAVFVDAYFKELRFFTKDKDKLINALHHSFSRDVIFLAEMNGEIIGMVGCSNNKVRAIHLDKTQLRLHLGFFTGHMMYRLMHKEFNIPLPYPDSTGYIECAATMEKARGKGAATALIKYLLKELPYHEFILEVTDANQIAYQFYEKIGFTVFSRKIEKHSKLKGFKERIYMHKSEELHATAGQRR